MSNAVYVLHADNDWADSHSVEAIFWSREKAVSYMTERYPDYQYNERWERWTNDYCDTYFEIQKFDVF